MSANTIAVGPSMPKVRPALVAWSIGVALGLFVIAAGFISSTPLPVFGWAAAFLLLAVASDVRRHRIPNALTLPALLAALVASPMVGATSGLVAAALGAALGFALLIGPYALGGVGAGDVKALMALGAWIGPEATLGTAAWAVIAGGAFGVAMLGLRRELDVFGRRWGRMLVRAVTQRRIAYEPPAAGSIASGGIPFAAAIAVGLAAQWYGGSPW
ncbi:MAG TPA: prepilin peptidase [Myxococcota bacterium]|nr:prepilin peptidase [Myxococcota bacterium]